MPSAELGRGPSPEKPLHRLNMYLEDVQETYDRVIHSQQPLYYSAPVYPHSYAPEPIIESVPSSSNLVRFLDQRAPQLAAVVAARPLHRSATAFEAFLEKVMADPAELARLNSDPELAANTIELFEASPWISEELVRRPSLIEAVGGEAAPHDSFSEASELRLYFRHE